jgi:transcriptional regulator with XRE-family HTH domain
MLDVPYRSLQSASTRTRSHTQQGALAGRMNLAQMRRVFQMGQMPLHRNGTKVMGFEAKQPQYSQQAGRVAIPRLPVDPLLVPREASVSRRRLGDELQRARENAGLTQRAVAQGMDWSLNKQIRIETGTLDVAMHDLRALLALYRVTDPARITGLVELARASQARSPWQEYRELVSSEYFAYLTHEASAAAIRNFEPLTIPGLLQIEDYTREILELLPGDRTSQDVAQLARLRVERQRLLTKPNAPQVFFVLGEGALRQVVGSVHVMRRQLRHLLDVAGWPNVQLLVKPFRQPASPSWRASFVHFGFEGPQDAGIVYFETFLNELLVREATFDEADEPTPRHYLSIFRDIQAQAQEADTVSLIEAAINLLGSEEDD